jgi:AcrR family transcriptional regulator
LTRQTAAERRETVLAAAIAEFAGKGYYGAPTEQIAKRAGISHAYLFRLFPTKKDLFLAVVDRSFDTTLEAFRRAGENPGEDETPIEAMGRAYLEMLSDRDRLLIQQQIYAADDPDIRAKARERFGGLCSEIKRLSGEDDVRSFVAQGMLLNVIVALGIDPEPWILE